MAYTLVSNYVLQRDRPRKHAQPLPLFDPADKRRKYRAFRIRSRVHVKNQLHLKAILIWYDDRIEFIQFSRNIDVRGPFSLADATTKLENAVLAISRCNMM